ncbi:hypothetical protein BH11ACT7_BH11ACT7_34300 [soil metagenome]
MNSSLRALPFMRIAFVSGAVVLALPLAAGGDAQSATAIAVNPTGEIREILGDAHVEANGYRTDAVDSRQDIHATQRQAVGDSVVVIWNAEGDGTAAAEVQDIVAVAQTDIQADRQSILASHASLEANREAAAADIKAVVADNHDGTVVAEVGAIVDAAQLDIADEREVISAAAEENLDIRKSTAVDVAEVKKSGLSDEIDMDEAAEQIVTLRTSSHAEIESNHTEMSSAHKEVKSTRQQAAKDAGSAVKNRSSSDDS